MNPTAEFEKCVMARGSPQGGLAVGLVSPGLEAGWAGFARVFTLMKHCRGIHPAVMRRADHFPRNFRFNAAMGSSSSSAGAGGGAAGGVAGVAGVALSAGARSSLRSDS
jgi:hypothetical protein